jgi:hypothetical protein
LISRRFSSVAALRGGGAPSNTNTSRSPYSAMSLVVRKNSPERCEVTRPCASQSGVPSRRRISARNWYSSPLPSTASIFPRSASSAIGWFWMIGVRTTPT